MNIEKKDMGKKVLVTEGFWRGVSGVLVGGDASHQFKVRIETADYGTVFLYLWDYELKIKEGIKKWVGEAIDQSYFDYFFNYTEVKIICWHKIWGRKEVIEYQKKRYYAESNVSEMADQILAEHLGLAQKEGFDGEINLRLERK